ncbi:hypothetical protein [Microbacterium sp.]|uniref:hypothetical protein n=1 Tax=Microbacterium sp. TaxID=51671 RepID=UPI0039E5CDA7
MTSVMDRPTRRSAHGQAVASAIPEIVGRLRAVLGRDVLAVLVGRTPRAVTRWAAGDAEPPAREEDLLRDAFQIAQVLSEVEPDEVVRAWFMGMNPQLDDESPVEALREGRGRDAMAAARAFVNAG